jgi:hypothetical protein
MSLQLQKMPSTTLKSPITVKAFEQLVQNCRFYKTQFNTVASALKIPVWLLVGKACVESGGTQFLKTRGGSTLNRSLDSGIPENDNYVGLMQVGSIPCVAALQYLSQAEGTYSNGVLLKAPKGMTDACMVIVKKHLPRYDPNKKGSAKANQSAAFEKAKTSAEFNILMGGLILCILLYQPRYNRDGIIRLDIIVAAYNTGEGYSAYKQSFVNTASLLNALSTFLKPAKVPETRGHILKLCGTDGIYDLLSNNKIRW